MRPRTLITCSFALIGSSAAVAQIVSEPGWPVQTNFSVSPSATIAQLDGDPQLEIVIASQDQQVYLYNHNGALMPGWPQFIGNTLSPDQYAIINASPALADLTNDGDIEIVVGSNDGKLYVFNVNGSLEFPPYTAGWMIFSTPSIGDIDGDADLEIVFGDNTGRINALNPNGAPVMGFPVLTPYAIRGCPALGNLDSDPQLEIVCPSEATAPDLWALNGDGTNVPGWPRDVDPNLGLFSSPALGDLDLDGDLDIVVGMRNGSIAALDKSGAYLPGFPVAAGYSCLSSPTLVDLDNDPQLEIVVGMNDSKVTAYNHDGTLMPGWPVTTSYTVISSPSVADIDRDGRLEIVVGENTGKVYAFETTGALVSGFPLTSPTYTIYSSPLLADLDVDGSLELLVGCNDTKIYCWDLGPNTLDRELMPWPEWRNDPRNHARLNRPVHIGFITHPPSIRPGASADLSVQLINISGEAQKFQIWLRAFDDTLIGGVAPIDVVDVALPSGQTAIATPTLRLPCGQAPGAYRVQVYAGEIAGGHAFDTHSFTIDLTAQNPGDVVCDGVVNVNDLLAVVGAWGPCPNPPASCPADIAPAPAGDGVVDVNDLLLVIGNWS